jgi:Glycosyltransferase family 92
MRNCSRGICKVSYDGTRMFRCTSLSLPSGAGYSREIRRPPGLRSPDFCLEYDAYTLFYDLFESDPEYGPQIVGLGPPLWNLSPVLLASSIGSVSLRKLISRYYDRGRSSDLWLAVPCAVSMEMRFSFGNFTLTPQPSQHSLYDGKRVLYTLNKDNNIRWITDWIRFHEQHHGADAVLIYDNASTRYTGEWLELKLRSTFPSMVVNVVHWPFIYGPQGVGKVHWDSDFCQTGAFQDARFRFMHRARSVLNCDVDELVVSPKGVSVFEAAEEAESGCICFIGHWVSSVAVSPVPIEMIRHSDFVFLERAEAIAPKWCAVPTRCSLQNSWGPHSIWGKDTRACLSRDFSYRHFRAITTNWKYQRCQAVSVGASCNPPDDILQSAFELLSH